MYAGQSRNITLVCISSSPFNLASAGAIRPRRFRWLRPGLKDRVERRLAGPAEAGKARLGDHVADPGLAGLGAERQPDLLRQRRGGAQQGREAVVGPPDRV